MAAQAGGVKKLRNLAGRAGQGAIALALALVSLAAAPTPPKIHADPMLHRLMRRHGVGVDASGRPTPIGRSELEYYSRFLAVDPHGPPPTARIRLRLDDSVRASLENMGFKVYGRLKGFASAVVPIDRLPELADVPGIEWMQVVRVPALELNISAPAIGADQAAAIYRTRGDGVLVGDVDSGVDWHHADFRNQDGTTRIRYLWDQTTSCSAGVGSVPPPPFDFGCQYTESEINAALAGGPSFTFTDVDGHGTHVLGIAGGNGRGTGNGQPSGVYVGVASRANLIMIKIFPDVQGACSRCFDVGLGLDMIDAKAAEFGLPYVVNLSLGTHLGGHDGSDADEQTIDALTGPGKPGKAVVKAAGNERGLGIHVSGTVATGGTNNHTFTIPQYTPAPGTFNDVQAWEMWYKGGDSMTVSLLDPTSAPCGGSQLAVSGSTGTGFHGVGTNSGTLIVDDTGSPSINGDRFFEAEVDDQLGAAPCRGTWTFRVHGDNITQGGRYDIWIFFSSFGAAQTAVSWNAPIDLTELVSIPGTSLNVTTVGAFVTRQGWTDVDGQPISYTSMPTIGSLAPFSSPGPTRDGRMKPEITAPGMGIASTLSIDAAPGILADPNLRLRVVQDGVHWVIEGTSMAAPHVTGVYAQMLTLNPTLDAIELRSLATAAARRDAFTGPSANNDWGFGKVDALGAVENLIKNIPALQAASDGVTFGWNGTPLASTYNVYRGDIGLLNGTYYGTCFRQGLSSPAFTDTDTPIPGSGFFYLITGVKDGVEGLLGFKSDGSPEPNDAPCSP